MSSRTNSLLKVTKDRKKNTRQRPGGANGDKARNVSSQGTDLLLAAPPRWGSHGSTGPVVLGASTSLLDGSVKDTVIDDGKHLNASTGAAAAARGGGAGVSKSEDEQRIAELQAELARLKQFKKKQVAKVMSPPTDVALADKYQYRDVDFSDPRNFCPASGYTGRRDGFVFKKGDRGLGYYRDELLPPPGAKGADGGGSGAGAAAGATKPLSSASPVAAADSRSSADGDRQKCKQPEGAAAAAVPGKAAPDQGVGGARQDRNRDRDRDRDRDNRRRDRDRDRSQRGRSRSHSRDRGRGGRERERDRGSRRHSRSRSRDRRSGRRDADRRRHSSRDRDRPRDRDRDRRRGGRSRSRSRDRRHGDRRRRRSHSRSRERRKHRSSSSSSDSSSDDGADGSDGAGGSKARGVDAPEPTAAAPDDPFDFNANIIAERIAELENAKTSPRRGPADIVADLQQCFADGLRVLHLHTGKPVCSRADFFKSYAALWSDPGVAPAAGGRPKRLDLQKRIYMQRHACARASATTTFALDFKRFLHSDSVDSAKAFWELLGVGAGSAADHTDVVFLFMALQNKIQVVYVAPDAEGLGADETVTLASSRFRESAVFKDAKEFAENLSDGSLGALDVHFHDYHTIEEVNLENIMAKAMQGK